MSTRWENMNGAEQVFCIELENDRDVQDWIEEQIKAAASTIPDRPEHRTPAEHVLFELADALKQRYFYDEEPEDLPTPYQSLLEHGLSMIGWRNVAWGLMPEWASKKYRLEED